MNPLIAFLTQGKAQSHATGMNPEFARALGRFLSAAPDRGVSIYSGYRSPEHQARLFKNAVAKHGSISAARTWVAPPGKSQHNHGGAADLRYANDAIRKWAHENAAQYGLNFRMSHEPWHVELLNAAHNQTARPPMNPVLSEALRKSFAGQSRGFLSFGPEMPSAMAATPTAAPAATDLSDVLAGPTPGGPARPGLSEDPAPKDAPARATRDATEIAIKAIMSEALGKVSV